MILMLRLILGWALIGAGAVVLPTPVPIGLVMVIVGLALVAPESRWLQAWLRRRRAANPAVSARLAALGPRLPRPARHLIDLTDPDAALARRPADAGCGTDRRDIVDAPAAAGRAAPAPAPAPAPAGARASAAGQAAALLSVDAAPGSDDRRSSR